MSATLFAVAGGLSGCADSSAVNLPFPNISNVAKVKNKLLSKKEKDDAIGDLTREQENHRDTAIKEIEKR